jgi:(1->4)-alpha-D-glucan 1-alpha-D-glucosylmutase
MNPLERLCSLRGIQSDYVDIRGETQACSDDTRRSLLRSMRIPAATDAEVSESLEAWEADLVARMIPPVFVIQEDADPIEVPLWFAEALAAQPCRWRLTLESGEELVEDFRPSALHSFGQIRVQGVRYLRYGLQLPVAPRSGYHSLTIQGAGREDASRLVVTPRRCFQAASLEEGGRAWGLATQLYAVRSRRNWGMGDFTDLRALAGFTAKSGGDLLGINPLHALFPHDPGKASPYGPSSRRHTNLLYLDVETLADFAECGEARAMVHSGEFQAVLRALRAAELVDYNGVARAKFAVLELLHRHFLEHHRALNTERGQAFESHRRQGGKELEGLARFQALQEHFHRESEGVNGWLEWPKAFQDPHSPEVESYARAHAERISFWEYLHWQADLQLASAMEGARALALGLYGDLATGVDRGGAETWLHQEHYALGASVGAPPDDFNFRGQDWGLPPMIPHRLMEAAFEPFIAALRAGMRYAGALRIDHVMGLMRLFWVPEGGQPSAGTYVAYPHQDLLAILALESQRHQCLVIGEDLGTVPDVVRAANQEWGILSCHPLYFERSAGDGSFKAPADYPREALVSVGTHDLPTLHGYWQGRDLVLRSTLGLYPSETERQQRMVERARDQAQMRVALEREGLLAGGTALGEDVRSTMDAELTRLVHTYLAHTPSKIFIAQVEDILEQVEQVNLPGSHGWQHPNWRRKLSLDLEEWEADPRFAALAASVQDRKRPAPFRTDPAEPSAEPWIPRATYRLQLNRDFTLPQATALVPYLHALGVSHVYTSPLLKARSGSLHGYDIVDHGCLNPEIGTPADFQIFVEALHKCGMGLIVDTVPNHMAVLGCENEWWQDVLENGLASRFASFFDIDWRPLKEELHGKVLLPVLRVPYGQALASGELNVDFDETRGQFHVACHGQRFLTDPREYPGILLSGIEQLAARLGKTSDHLQELESVAAAFGHLPPRDRRTPEAVEERARDKEVHKRRLAALCERSEDIRLFIGENLRHFNGTPGDLQSREPLHTLLQAQAFRLAHWWVATDEINYRRFFDLNDLASLRVELEPVFDATHPWLLEQTRLGRIDGFRVDHPDGLHDPLAYFQRLQSRATAAAHGRPPYLVAEKILSKHERLPAEWPVHGDTGYSFANEAIGLFVDAESEPEMDRIYAAFTGRTLPFEETLYQCKSVIIRTSMASELNVLTAAISGIALADVLTRDFTIGNLRDALMEIVACFPVYRTYITPGHVADQDRHQLEWAVAAAKKRNPWLDDTVFDFIAEVLSTRIATGHAQDYVDRVHAFAMKFQQYTAPVMAKGLEDTCFYRYNRLISLNDVGSDPRVFGTTSAAFHHQNAERARHWPGTMLATSTHDSKRSEDARLRIHALSEMPEAWEQSLQKWARLNFGKKTEVDGELAPSANDEYFLYQTLLGAWPSDPLTEESIEPFRQRIEDSMLKAIREAKERTSWIHPKPPYEKAVASFVSAILSHPGRNPFLIDLSALAKRVSRTALLSSLSLVLIKCTSPGVPDFFQGNELLQPRLVDPDNRRAVDFELRRHRLAEFRRMELAPATDWGEAARAFLDRVDDGSAKLYVVWRTLRCRSEHPELFQKGSYLPSRCEGPLAGHLCAYARQWNGWTLLAVASRLFDKLPSGNPVGTMWSASRFEVPTEGIYWNVMTRESLRTRSEDGQHWIAAEEALARFPVALLLSHPEDPTRNPAME